MTTSNSPNDQRQFRIFTLYHVYFSRHALSQPLFFLYAIINLFLLLVGFGFTVNTATPVIIVLSGAAIFHQLIHNSIEYARSRKPLWLDQYIHWLIERRPPLFNLILSGAATLLSFFTYCINYAIQIVVQIRMLPKLRLSLPIMRLYRPLFLVTGLSGGVVALLSVLKYIITNQPDSDNRLNQSTRSVYLGKRNMSIIQPIGVVIGAIFYAASGYQATFGLLCLATHFNLLIMGAATINRLAVLDASSIFIHTLVAWGEHGELLKQSTAPCISTIIGWIYLLQLMAIFGAPIETLAVSAIVAVICLYCLQPKDHQLLKPIFSYCATIVSSLRSMVAAACLLSGWQRIAGVVAVVGSAALNRVENRFAYRERLLYEARLNHWFFADKDLRQQSPPRFP
jgi:hypothetical protein